MAETEGLQSGWPGDNYVGRRSGSGWATTATSPPREAEIVLGGGYAGGPFAYADDLGSWVLFGATQPQSEAAEGQIFRGGLDGSLATLSPPLVPIDDTGDFRGVSQSFGSDGTSSNLLATVFRPFLASTAFLPGDPRGTAKVEPGGEKSSYVAYRNSVGEPTLELLARDDTGTVYGGRCGSRLGGASTQGAISADGSRIYFSTRPAQGPSVGSAGPVCDPSTNPLRIFERTETSSGPQLTELLPGEPAAPGDDLYQGASADGSKIYITSPRKLSASDQDVSAEACSSKEVGKSVGCDLYLYDAAKPEAERLTQVSAGVTGDPTPGKAANVLGSPIAVSTDGSHVYFLAQGILSGENSEHKSPTAGKPNLYLYERDAAFPSDRTAFIGTLAEADIGNARASALPMLGAGKEDGGDGHILVFTSKAPLTADDGDGAFRDVFRYNAEAESLQRISKAGPGGGEAPAADASVIGGAASAIPNFAEQGRWVSEDGQTVAFATAEPLAGGDSDGKPNPYLWKEGRPARLPSEIDEAPVLSPDGEEVAFTTAAPLLPADGDSAQDVYVARAGGGFPPAVEAQQPCDPLFEGACQGPVNGPPGEGGVTTESLAARGNQHTAPACRKGFKRKHGRCVKKLHRKSKHRRNHAGHGEKGARR